MFLRAQSPSKQDQTYTLAKAYERQGLYKKAVQLYEQLLEQPFTHKVHEAYFMLLLRMQKHKQAERYLQDVLKERDDLRIWVDLIYLWRDMGIEHKGRQTIMRLIQEVKHNSSRVHMFVHYLSTRRLYKEGLLAYKAARKVSKSPSAYMISMAQLYFALGHRGEGIEEYINYLRIHANYLDQLKNFVRSAYTESNDLDTLRHVLSRYRQNYPDVKSLFDLSVWLSIHLGTYEDAFAEAMVMDRRVRLGPEYFMDLGEQVFEQKAYTTAIKVFSYIATTYTSSSEARKARYYALYARERLYLGELPIVRSRFRPLIQEYKHFIAKSAHDFQAIEAQQRLARLYTRVLQAPDSAILILEQVLIAARPYAQLWATANIELGDAYLLNGQPWEATLRYVQVEKKTKDTKLLELAQFSRAKASYYQGVFALAKTQLDILRKASAKYVANDALFLSQLISWYMEKEETEHGSLRRLAAAELALEGGNIDSATHILQTLLEEAPQHKGGGYTRYFLAKVKCQEGAFAMALELLDGVMSQNWPLLSDKAMWLKGKILEEHMQNPQAAIDLYQNFIKKLPQSVYLPQVRRSLQRLLSAPLETH